MRLRDTKIAIVGGGLAGSLAAGMLGRAGIDAMLIDPHPAYPPDFRCEKLDGEQVGVLRRTGLADEVLRDTTPDREVWVARCGRVVERRPNQQVGFLYQDFVNAVRAAIPPSVGFVCGKATDIASGGERQRVTLSTGEVVSARLVVVASGLNVGLRHKLGMQRKMLSEAHSISIGFDAEPLGRGSFDFSALTYYGERPADRTAYLTLFPIGASIRANLFVYRAMQDPWLRQFRETPAQTLCSILPGLREPMGEFAVSGRVQIRPVDLYVTAGHRQPGVVLVGDAFASSCPAAGTGALKVLTDVERLCNVHIPDWLATPGMATDKIAAFYDDPVKTACDEHSLEKAFWLRSFSTEPGALWQAHRRLKFFGHWGRGMLRQALDGSAVTAAGRPSAAGGVRSRTA